jgi:hypothetical protein
LYIDAEKSLAIVDGDGSRAMVQTVVYRYDATVDAGGNVFRDDSQLDERIEAAILARREKDR